MDCRILRQLMLRSDGHLVCDDSNGYYIILGQVSDAPGWSLEQVLTGAVYGHVRRSFSGGQVPWRGVCETCDLFSAGGTPLDTLKSRLSIMVEPTLHCRLACPTCKRKQEASRRAGKWDLDPKLFTALLKSCTSLGIDIEAIYYLGWGEPLLHAEFAELTKIARSFAPHAVQEVTTTGNIDLHAGLADMDVDRIIVSCDGTNQQSYELFRRQGEFSRVLDFMANVKGTLKRKPFIEWKYIVFDHNDGDGELATAQQIADESDIDSLLFILTNSKNKSERFDADDLSTFPIISAKASISPAAALMKVQIQLTPVAVGDYSTSKATLIVDRCVFTVSNLLVLEGWSLAADGSYVDSIELQVGGTTVRTRTVHKRVDVMEAVAAAEGPNCGFLLRASLPSLEGIHRLTLVVTTAYQGTERFEVEIQSSRAPSQWSRVAKRLTWRKTQPFAGSAAIGSLDGRSGTG